MNLNQITTRIAELSAELLTLHKDLAFLVEGGVSRQSQPEFAPFDWKTLKEGSLVQLQSTITCPGEITLAPGIYKVDMVEDDDYTGTLPFAVIYDEENEHSCWVRLTDETPNQFRKVS